MSFMDPIPAGTKCDKCKVRPATKIWTEGVMAAVHGAYERRCDRCVVEEQLDHAKKMANTVSELERQLTKIDEDEREREFLGTNGYPLPDK